MVRRHALEGVGDEVAGAALGLGARLFLRLPDTACELVPNELLGTLEQVRLGLVDGHARDALELGHLRVARVLEVFLELLRVDLAVGDTLLAPRQFGQLPVDVLLFRQHALLDLEDLVAPLSDLLLDLGAQADRGLTRLDLPLPAQRVGLALRLAPHHVGLALGLADEQLARPARGRQARAREGVERQEGQAGSHCQADQDPDDDDHARSHCRAGAGASAGNRCPRRNAVLIRHRLHRDVLRIGVGKARVPRLGGSASRRRRRQFPSLALVVSVGRSLIRFGNALDAGKTSNDALLS